MKGYKYKDIMSGSFEMPTSRAELEAVYRTLAKTADQRMVRLEQAAAREGENNPYENVKEWAYKRGAYDVSQWSGESEKPRFNVKPPADVAALEAKIEDIKTFLSLKTSTIAGIKESFKERANTLNKEYGTDFKWDDMAKFFDSSLSEELDKSYGSDTKFYVLAEIQKNKKKILSGIKKAGEIDLKVPDEMINSFVQDTLSKHGEEVKKYLESLKK